MANEKVAALNTSLDGLRAVAIILVMLFHAGAPLAKAGWVGVDMFFVLSGFLITTLLLGEYKKNCSISLRMFWMRRFLRLMPIYVLYVAAISLAMYLGPEAALRSNGGWSPLEFALSFWVYLGNLPPQGGIWDHQHLARHLWSLSVEEQSYFLWPLILVALVKTRWLEPIAWLLVFCVALNNAIGYGGTPPAFLIYTRGIGLFIGCAVAISLDRRRSSLERLGLLSSAATTVILGVVLLVFAAFTYLIERYGFRESHLLPLGIPLLSLCMALLIANIWVRPDDRIGTWLSMRPLPQIGAISYGAYLYHMVAWQLVWRELLDGIESWPRIPKFGFRLTVFFVLTFCFAYLSYQFIEKPFLKLKERFRGSQSPEVSGRR